MNEVDWEWEGNKKNRWLGRRIDNWMGKKRRGSWEEEWMVEV